jgi:hypothetical protein
MTQINTDRSKIIENNVGGALVESEGTLLVESVAVIGGLQSEEGPSPLVAVEFGGLIMHTDQTAFVAAFFHPSRMPTMIGLLMEATLKSDPSLSAELLQTMASVIGGHQ